MSAITEGAALKSDEHDPHFEPVIRLTEQVEVKTNEENEEVEFKLRAKLFRFVSETNEWKERGTGDARLLKHKESKKIRLVMRRDKTLKVCANHLISSDMKLQPNVGSDRSWVWKVAADYSEEPHTSETFAIRFANSDLALQFKKAFEDAQKSNIEESLKLAPPKESEPVLVDETKEEKTVDKAEAEEDKEEVKEETKE